MVQVSPAPALLDTNVVNLWHTQDSLLGNSSVLVFLGPSTTTNATQNSSRIQAHVVSVGGLQSFPRLTINPTSAVYGAVHCLPEAKQGDETCRALAVSLLKYYREMPRAVRSILMDMVAVGRPDEKVPNVFDERHAASLAAGMVQVENAQEIANNITTAFTEKSLTWTDIDVILPQQSIIVNTSPGSHGQLDEHVALVNYGKFSLLVELLGTPCFLPSSKLRRAPSKPTAVSRTRILDEGQERALRRELRELVETERSYVAKLSDMINSPAVSYCRDSTNTGNSLVARSMTDLFPPSLDTILDLSVQFLDSIESFCESLGHLDSPIANGQTNLNAGREARDPSGTLGFSKIMLDFLPRFRDPYQDYLRASGQFSRILGELTRDNSSGFAQTVARTGEQRLKSWLIEPVQRLPRYNLFIGNLVNQLPAAHPAMTRFLSARDTIIDICALDGHEPMNDQLTATRLKKLTMKWPDHLKPEGRLVTAADALELKAPYKMPSHPGDGSACILLLFPDYVVALEKVAGAILSAHGLLAEVERASSAPSTLSPDFESASSEPLKFAWSIPLHETRFLEAHNNRLLSMECVRASWTDRNRLQSGANYTAMTRLFWLLGGYEGKAAKWNEEVGRSRMENRFPETMRDGQQWGLRSINPAQAGLGIFAAIFENDEMAPPDAQRKTHGRIEIIVDDSGKDERNPQGRERNGIVEIRGEIGVLPDDKFTLEFYGFNGYYSIDTATKDDFATIFLKRMVHLQRLHCQPDAMGLSQPYVSFCRNVIESIRPHFGVKLAETRKFRPPSPMKGLTSLFSSAIAPPTSPIKQLSGRLRGESGKESIAIAPSLQPTYAQFLPNSMEPGKVAVALVETQDPRGVTSNEQLEATFNTYLLALQSRRGNVVGRVLRARASADELSINELYNLLIENPSNVQAPAEVPVDVLFAAFEKFLNRAWRERMGPILDRVGLQTMQSILFSGASDTVARLRVFIDELAAQNRNALSLLINVLSDLLSGTGNDGDRGAMILTFAEALISEGNPMEYISLLDCLVANCDALFNAPAAEDDPVEGTLRHKRSFGTGSINSTSSSLRKKFGLGFLSRENSKHEPESRIAQMLKQFSKKPADAESQPPSLSRSFLSRTRSIDTRSGSPSRPQSSHSSQGDNRSRPGSAHNPLTTMETIGEKTAVIPTLSPKKKRRSSISDLSELRSLQPNLGNMPPPARRPGIETSLPKTQADPTKTTKPIGKLQKASSNSGWMNRGRPNVLKENTPPPIIRGSSVTTRSPSPTGRSQSPFGIPTYKHELPQITPVAPLSPTRRSQSPFGIPSHNNGLTDIKYIPPLSPTKAPTSPHRLRMQSPQKLRERLDREKKAIMTAGPELQSELAKIGEELSAINTSRSTNQVTVTQLTARVDSLGTQLQSSLSDLTTKHNALQADLQSSLVVAERKAKNLDELYREANTENELLYERFNSELGKILKGVRSGEGLAELKGQIEQAQDESSRLRKENQRLKRENLGLRSQLKDG